MANIFNENIKQNAAEVLEWSISHPNGCFGFRKQQDGEWGKVMAEVDAGRLSVVGEGSDYMVFFSRTPLDRVKRFY